MTIPPWTALALLLLALPAGCSRAPSGGTAAPRSPSALTAHQSPPGPSRPAPTSASARPTSPSPSPSPARTAATPTGTLHFIVNVGADLAPVVALGYNLFDIGPDEVASLPAGGRGLVWLGSLDNSDCAHPGYTFAGFTAVVDRLAGDPRVYGYFLSDEPHPGICPTAVADIRARADYIRAHDPTHKSFIVVVDGTNQCGGAYGCEYTALKPANSHVDLIGIDPYPCNVTANPCDYRKIDDTVHRATGFGIPIAALVPVFQAFGQACAASNYYRLPSAAELTTILAHWAARLPHPAFDYTYTWGRQGSSCPTLVDAPDLQAVMRAHNNR